MGEFYGNQHVGPEGSDAISWEYEDLREGVVSYVEEHGESPTTDDAAQDDRFPSLATIYKILDDGWNELLTDAGVEGGHVREYGPEEKAAMLQDLREVHQSVDSDYLTTRQYERLGEYGKTTIKQTFGSWSDACEKANIDAGEKYGITCEGPNGETLDSLQELRVAQVLDEKGLAYDAHPSVEDTRWVGDFYVPAYELWVEVNGFADGERPNAVDFERKLDYYEEHGLKCVVVNTPDELRSELRRRSRPD